MQKLKRKPLLTRLATMLSDLLPPVDKVLMGLPSFGKRLVIALMLGTVLILAMYCAGCAPQPVRPSLPPQADPRPMPVYDGQTFRDAILYLIEVREWGMSCEADKGVLRRVYGDE